MLTGHTTAHNFDKETLSVLQAELNLVNDRLYNLQSSCTAAFKHLFHVYKRQSRKRKENTRKSIKRKKARHVARTDEILKKLAPELKEGKTCMKEDL